MNADLKPYTGKLPPSLLKEIEEKCPASKIKRVAAKVLEEFEKPSSIQEKVLA